MHILDQKYLHLAGARAFNRRDQSAEFAFGARRVVHAFVSIRSRLRDYEQIRGKRLVGFVDAVIGDRLQ